MSGVRRLLFHFIGIFHFVQLKGLSASSEKCHLCFWFLMASMQRLSQSKFDRDIKTQDD